jgi:hypothetical protein
MFRHEDYHYGYTPIDFLLPVNENEDYGYEWPDGTLQVTKELHGYYVGGIGGKRKFDHLINIIRLCWPDGEDGRQKTDHCIDLCKQGIINTSVLRVLWACCYEKDLGVAGSASSGKTRPIAAYVLADWFCAPNETLTFICTTSLGASEDRIYGAIVQLHKASNFKFGTLLDYKKCNAIKALAIETGLEGKKAVETTRGRKNKRVRLIIDELPEMGSYVIQARVNLASNIDFQFIGIGNPMKMYDAHGELCRPDHPDGFKSVSKETPEWKTRTGKCIFLNGEWSPNFLVNESEPIPYEYLTSRDSLARMLELCYGNKESIEYMRNAVGFWPSATAEQTVLSRTLIEAYGGHLRPEWIGEPKKALCGLDTGFVVGGDKCVAHFGHIAQDVSGRKILHPFETRVYQAKDGEIFEKSIARQVVDDCIRHGVDPSGLGMDISNDGGKIAKAIIEYWLDDPDLKKLGKTNRLAYQIVAISSQGKPTERIVSDIDPVTCTVRYDRRVTEYWFSVRQGILNKVIKGIDLQSEYVAHLCSRLYEERKGQRIYIETKPDYKDRMKGVSPDDGDAFSYLVEMARQHGLEFITETAHREKVAMELRRQLERNKPVAPTLQLSQVGTYSSGSFGEADC